MKFRLEQNTKGKKFKMTHRNFQRKIEKAFLLIYSGSRETFEIARLSNNNEWTLDSFWEKFVALIILCGSFTHHIFSSVFSLKRNFKSHWIWGVPHDKYIWVKGDWSQVTNFEQCSFEFSAIYPLIWYFLCYTCLPCSQ